MNFTFAAGNLLQHALQRHGRSCPSPGDMPIAPAVSPPVPAAMGLLQNTGHSSYFGFQADLAAPEPAAGAWHEPRG